MNETIQPIRTPISQPVGEMPIPVFYSPAMVANSQSFSPSAGKPALAVKSWQLLGLPLQFRAPKPLSAEQFGVAHDPEFVADILSGRRRNGFGNCSTAVAASLPLTSGAMLSAAREALKNRIGAIAPCSGFHHAGYDFAGGYCTFNGLMVTAAVLLAEGSAHKVGILDFDQHWGNGTQDIIDRLHLDDAVVHYSPSEYSRPAKAEAFLAAIPEDPRALCRLRPGALPGRGRPAHRRSARRLADHGTTLPARPRGVRGAQAPRHPGRLEPCRRLPERRGRRDPPGTRHPRQHNGRLRRSPRPCGDSGQSVRGKGSGLMVSLISFRVRLMERPERVVLLEPLLRQPGGATIGGLMAALGERRDIISDDLEAMRDEMGLPVRWDPDVRDVPPRGGSGRRRAPPGRV